MAEDDGGAGEVPDQVDAEQARELIAGGRVQVIDIRDEDEFAAERMSNAVRADPGDVSEELEALDDGREAVLVVCADGSRSADVAEELRSDGTEATSIDGGFDAWVGDGLPTAPGRDEEYEGPPVKIPGAVESSDDEEDEASDEDEDD